MWIQVLQEPKAILPASGTHRCSLPEASRVLNNRGVGVLSKSERAMETGGETPANIERGSVNRERRSFDQLGQQVLAKFTPFSSRECTALMYTHTHINTH